MCFAAAAEGAGDGEAAAEPNLWAKAKLPFYFFLWYAFNIAFNIYNKQTLNVFPCPWLLATLQLLAGSVWMAAMWALRLQPLPKISKGFLVALVPVTLFHLVGHVAACVSLSKVAVSFTHVIKAAEPVLSVILCGPILGEVYSKAVWASLVPIVAGCSLAAVKEVSFTLGGLNYALASNLGMVLRNIASKMSLGTYDVDGINLYACISILGTVLLFPIACAVEGAKWGAAYEAVLTTMPFAEFMQLVVVGGFLYHLYNQTSYQCLVGISPTTFSVGNTMKRVAVIVSSIIFFKNPVTALNAVGSAMAIAGAYFYSVARAQPGAVRTRSG